jgi:hypothetical protein
MQNRAGAKWHSDAAIAPQVDSMPIKAIARAFRLQRIFETGQYATVEEISTVEKIDPSHVSRVLRLALLVPTIVEAVLNGRRNSTPTPAEAMASFPVEWKLQKGSRISSRRNTRHSGAIAGRNVRNATSRQMSDNGSS